MAETPSEPGRKLPGSETLRRAGGRVGRVLRRRGPDPRGPMPGAMPEPIAPVPPPIIDDWFSPPLPPADGEPPRLFRRLPRPTTPLEDESTTERRDPTGDAGADSLHGAVASVDDEELEADPGEDPRWAWVEAVADAWAKRRDSDRTDTPHDDESGAARGDDTDAAFSHLADPADSDSDTFSRFRWRWDDDADAGEGREEAGSPSIDPPAAAPVLPLMERLSDESRPHLSREEQRERMDEIMANIEDVSVGGNFIEGGEMRTVLGLSPEIPDALAARDRYPSTLAVVEALSDPKVRPEEIAYNGQYLIIEKGGVVSYFYDRVGVRRIVEGDEVKVERLGPVMISSVLPEDLALDLGELLAHNPDLIEIYLDGTIEEFLQNPHDAPTDPFRLMNDAQAFKNAALRRMSRGLTIIDLHNPTINDVSSDGLDAHSEYARALGEMYNADEIVVAPYQNPLLHGKVNPFAMATLVIRDIFYGKTHDGALSQFTTQEQALYDDMNAMTDEEKDGILRAFAGGQDEAERKVEAITKAEKEASEHASKAPSTDKREVIERTQQNPLRVESCTVRSADGQVVRQNGDVPLADAPVSVFPGQVLERILLNSPGGNLLPSLSRHVLVKSSFNPSDDKAYLDRHPAVAKFNDFNVVTLCAMTPDPRSPREGPQSVSLVLPRIQSGRLTRDPELRVQAFRTWDTLSDQHGVLDIADQTLPVLDASTIDFDILAILAARPDLANRYGAEIINGLEVNGHIRHVRHHTSGEENGPSLEDESAIPPAAVDLKVLYRRIREAAVEKGPTGFKAWLGSGKRHREGRP